MGFSNLTDLKDKIKLIKGSVTVAEDWKKIPKDIDFVYHFAAINGTKYFYEIPEIVLEVNVTGTLNFLNWLKDSNVKRIFFASSSEVYGFPNKIPTPETEPLMVPDPKNPRFSYSSSKIIGETMIINYAKKYGLDYIIGRFHNVYGPAMGFEHVIPDFLRKCIKNEEFKIQGTGNQTRCFCFIVDAINGINLISEHPNAINKIFNIGTSEEITINELIILLSKIHGKKIVPIKTGFENTGIQRRVPDLTKIFSMGYKPRVSLEEGLKITYNWYYKYYTSN